MANKRFCMGIMAIVLVFGITVIGCDEDPDDTPTGGNDKETLYDPVGTWDINIEGENAVVIVTGNSYTFSGAGFTDAGTYTRNGNVATLRTSTQGWNNAIMGYVTLTSNTTMTLNLVSPSYITGIFVGHKRINDSPSGFIVKDTIGTLTINGIPSGYDGRFISCYNEGLRAFGDITNISSSSITVTNGIIDNGSVMLKVWKGQQGQNNYLYDNFTGSGNYTFYMSLLLGDIYTYTIEWGSETGFSVEPIGYVNVTFTNGQGAVNLSNYFD